MEADDVKNRGADRVPFSVGAAQLVSYSNAYNRLILAFDSSASVEIPVTPTYEVVDGGV